MRDLQRAQVAEAQLRGLMAASTGQPDLTMQLEGSSQENTEEQDTALAEEDVHRQLLSQV